MRINYLRLLSSALALNFFIACSSEGDPEPAIVAEEGQMAAKVDGADWTSTQTTGLFKNGYLNIVGRAQDGSSIVLAVKGTEATAYTLETEPSGSTATINTGSFTPANPSVTNATYSSIKKADGDVGGTINITAWDKEAKLVSGTFDMRVSRAKLNDDGSTPNPPQDETITVKGSFNKVPYTEDMVGPANNSASAKIDGANFTPTVVGGAKSFGKLVLSFMDSGNRTIALRIPENITTGTYDLGGFAFGDYAATYSPTASTVFDSSNGGKLTISKHDIANKRIEGTFDFNAASFPMGGETQYVITAGSFALTYN